MSSDIAKNDEPYPVTHPWYIFFPLYYLPHANILSRSMISFLSEFTEPKNFVFEMTDFESFFQNTDTHFVSFHFANNSEPLLTTYFPSRLSFVSVTSKNIPDVVQTWDEFNEFKSLNLYLHPFFSCRLWQKNSVPRVLCFSSQQQIVLFDWICTVPY